MRWRVPLALFFVWSNSAHALEWPDVAVRVEQSLASTDVTVRRSGAERLRELRSARVDSLIAKALDDGDVDVRLAAARAATRTRAADLATHVLPWLGDRDVRLRLAACEVIRALGAPSGVAPLARALSDSDAQVRTAAAGALGTLGSKDAVGPLLGKLDDQSPVVRMEVIRALTRIGDPRAVVPLFGKVQDSVPEVRRDVARALGDLGDPRAAQALVLQLRDNAVEVRIQAVQALGRLKDPAVVEPLAGLLSDRHAPLRAAALAALGRVGSAQAIAVLVGALGSADDASSERTPVRDALVAVGPQVIPSLLAFLDKPTSSAAAAGALWVLGELRATQAEDAITSGLRRSSLPTRPALEALGKLGQPRSMAIVLENARSRHPDMRTAALRAAASLLDPEAPDGRPVEPLAALLGDRHTSSAERALIAELLGRTGAERAAPHLIELVDHPDKNVALSAIDALGQLRTAAADAPLVKQLTQEDPERRVHAAKALHHGGLARARDLLLEQLERGEEIDRPAWLTALGGILSRAPSDRATGTLASMLRAASGPERDAIVEALSQDGSDRALQAVLSLTAGDTFDRAQAAAALAGSKSPDAVAAERRLARDGEAAVRANAAWGLGSLGTRQDLALLASLIRDPDVLTATNAAAAFARVSLRTKAGPEEMNNTLCAAAKDKRAFVRANAWTGLAVFGSRCAEESVRRAVLEDASEVARAAAASSLARSASTDDRRALERCASVDRSGHAARACALALAPLPNPTVGRRVPSTVYLVTGEDGLPRPLRPFAVQFSDGFIRMGITDRRGALFEPTATPGEIMVHNPLDALEPPSPRSGR